jgi:poly(A) polymerase
LGYRHGFTLARDALLLRAVLLESPLLPDALTTAEQGARETFPVKSRDLIPEYEGVALGDKLRALEDRWIASGFALGKSDLLD